MVVRQAKALVKECSKTVENFVSRAIRLVRLVGSRELIPIDRGRAGDLSGWPYRRRGWRLERQHQPQTFVDFSLFGRANAADVL